MTLSFAVIIIGYFLGSIPFGVLISKTIYKVDIQELGSKNPGATNVWRTLGSKPGATTLALDILKGSAAVFLAKAAVPGEGGTALFSGLAAIIGHNWSFFLKGRGGKGVATSAGVFLALTPLHALVGLLAFAIFFFSTKHVSVGSMAGAVALLTSTFILETSPILRFFILAASAMILIKHLPNMKRLARGEEPKVNLR